MSSFKDLVDQANKSDMRESGGSFFKIEDGNKNVLRILTAPVMFYKNYDEGKKRGTNGIVFSGCGYKGTPLGLAYVLDRNDNKVKLAELKWQLIKDISMWEDSGDYEIDGTFPMKNDIRITKTGSGMQTRYDHNIIPKQTEVPSDFLDKELKDKKSCQEIIDEWQKKSKAGNGNYDVDGVDSQQDDGFDLPEMPDPFAKDEKIDTIEA